MRLMSKIAIMGERDSITGFAALGLTVCPVESAQEAKRTLRELAKEESDCSIVYVTEQCAAGIMGEIERYKNRVSPAVILVPGRDGALGYGKKAMSDAIEKAIGSDII